MQRCGVANCVYGGKHAAYVRALSWARERFYAVTRTYYYPLTRRTGYCYFLLFFFSPRQTKETLYRRRARAARVSSSSRVAREKTTTRRGTRVFEPFLPPPAEGQVYLQSVFENKRWRVMCERGTLTVSSANRENDGDSN